MKSCGLQGPFLYLELEASLSCSSFNFGPFQLQRELPSLNCSRPSRGFKREAGTRGFGIGR
jgi:hypothetical protein